MGLGLYLAVERGYPVYWLIALVLAGLLAATAVSLGDDVSTTESIAVAGH